MPVYTATRQLRSRSAAGLQRPSLTASPPAQVEPKAEVKSEETQVAVKIEQNPVTLKTEEAQTSVKLEDARSSGQIKAEETQQSASQPACHVGRVTKRSRSTSAEDTESSAPFKRRTDGRNKATTDGVQERRQKLSPRKKDGGKKKKEKKRKKASGRPPKPSATHPSTWRQSRVPFFDTICSTAAMKEYRLTPHDDLVDLSYDEERSKNGPAYWNPMKLYKTRDVEYRAWRKHGGPEGWEWKLNRLRETYTKKHPGTPFTIPIWDFLYTKNCPCGAYIFSGSMSVSVRALLTAELPASQCPHHSRAK